MKGLLFVAIKENALTLRLENVFFPFVRLLIQVLNVLIFFKKKISNSDNETG